MALKYGVDLGLSVAFASAPLDPGSYVNPLRNGGYHTRHEADGPACTPRAFYYSGSPLTP